MDVELIYDTSLLCHATLTTLIQKTNPWKGPLCFEDIINSFRLLYTYITRDQDDSSVGQNVLQFRYKDDYSGEENMWGVVDAYKRLLGLIVFAQGEVKDDFQSSLECFRRLLAEFRSTLQSGLLVLIVHNETENALRFNELAKINCELMRWLKQSTENLPTHSEVVVLPGNGFQDEQSCMQECVNRRIPGEHNFYYRFSRTLDTVLRDTLLREAHSLRLSIADYLECHFKQPKQPTSQSTVIAPSNRTRCFSFSGRYPASVTGVSIDEMLKPSEHSGNLLEPFNSALGWASQNDSPLENRERLFRMNKLTGDLYVQLGEFQMGQRYYLNAISYFTQNDPPIWYSALLTGFAAALHLYEADIFGQRRFSDFCRKGRGSRHLRLFEVPPCVLEITGHSSGLDLAATKSRRAKIPRSASHALFLANQSLQELCKLPALPRCVVEIMYKQAEHLVVVSKRSRAIRALTSLQTYPVPQGNAFIFERYYVLANLYSRLQMHHKAGMLHYLLENSLFHALPRQVRPPPALTRVSKSCHMFIHRFTSSYLGSSCLTEAYQLHTSPSGFRRVSTNPPKVAFVCFLVSPTTDPKSVTPLPGWPVLQLQLLISVVEKILNDIAKSSLAISEANWNQCTMLLSYIFSLINGWQKDVPEADLANYIEILRSLAGATPVDQPSVPTSHLNDGQSPCHHNEESPKSNAVRSSFGKPLSPTLHPFSALVELRVDKIPIVRSLSIPRLPPHRLPSCMSFEALSSMVEIEDGVPDLPDPHSRKRAFSRHPIFITNPSQLSSSDTVDWVCNDLSHIDVVFDNPFAIQLELDDVHFELTEDTEDDSARTIILNSVQIIPALATPVDEVTLVPLSGCLFEQVSLYFTHASPPGVANYIDKVVLEPNSTQNRFVFTLVVPFQPLEGEDHKWRVRTISYRLLTFGGFRVSLPLNGRQGSSWMLYSTPEGALKSEEGGRRMPVASAVHKTFLPPIRMCPPLPRLCILVGACADEPVERVVRHPSGSILSSLAAIAPSFSPCLQLVNTLDNQENKQNICNIIIELHPYETRWLPIQVFAGLNACPPVEGPSSDHELEHHYSGDFYLNLLHISLQTPLTTNKFLQKYHLLLGQFLQILKVLDVRQKLPLKLPRMAATDHCQSEDLEANSYCGTLWLKADSAVFWDAWFSENTSVQSPNPQNLVAQLCIEFAANVASVATQVENLSRLVIGRCVRIGIELRLLTSLDAPIRILNPSLTYKIPESDTSPANCNLEFKLESVMSSMLTNVIQPSSRCRFYRVDVDVEFFWCRQNCLLRGNLKALPLATKWTSFIAEEGTRNDADDTQINDLVAGLISCDVSEIVQREGWIGLPLSRLLHVFQQADLPPLFTAARPTDELLLPLPLPHSLGRLLERLIEIRWTAHMQINLLVPGTGGSSPIVQNYYLPTPRSGRLVPLSPVSEGEPSSPWYFPLLKNPRFVAKILWRNNIWLQLVQCFQSKLPSFLAQDCPVCREIAASGKEMASSCRNSLPVDAKATHVLVSPLSKVHLELYGGIDVDEFLTRLHGVMSRQFSPLVEPSARSCVDLSESEVGFVNEVDIMANPQDGMALYRIWTSLEVFEADESSKYLTTSKPLSDGSAFCLSGCLRGQTGLFMGKRSSDSQKDGVDNLPYSNGSTQSIKGSVSFMKTGNFFVRGFAHTLPLLSAEAGGNTTPVFRSPSTNLFFEPIKETSHSFLFHVRN